MTKSGYDDHAIKIGDLPVIDSLRGACVVGATQTPCTSSTPGPSSTATHQGALQVEDENNSEFGEVGRLFSAFFPSTQFVRKTLFRSDDEIK